MKRKTLLFRPGFLAKVMILCLTLLQIPVILHTHDSLTNHSYAASADRPIYKSTYLWKTKELLDNRVSTFQFLEQNGVNLLFLQIDPSVSKAGYRSFIREAAGRGIEVHALGGAANWVLPDQQINLYKFIEWVRVYNDSAPVQSRFKGIHLDVEPYVTKEWANDPDKMIGLWRDTISGFVEEMKMDTPGLTAGADMPSWLENLYVYDELGVRTTLSNWMIRTLDQTTLMAYRDNAADIINSVSVEMNEAEKSGKPLIVAVETLPSSEGPITFYNKGRAAMMKELGIVNDTLKSRAPYTGYAVHDFAGWSGLKE